MGFKMRAFEIWLLLSFATGIMVCRLFEVSAPQTEAVRTNKRSVARNTYGDLRNLICSADRFNTAVLMIATRGIIMTKIALLTAAALALLTVAASAQTNGGTVLRRRRRLLPKAEQAI
jgi:hypothetical protein